MSSTTLEPQYNLAKMIARNAHAGQVDKGGKPYFDHVKHVGERANKVYGSLVYAVIGYLHDVVEDVDHWSIGAIRDVFGTTIADSVDALTKRKGEAYTDYLKRVGADFYARRVKLVDLEHNMDITRLPANYELNDYDLRKLNSYKDAWNFLMREEK